MLIWGVVWKLQQPRHEPEIEGVYVNPGSQGSRLSRAFNISRTIVVQIRAGLLLLLAHRLG
jgi:hypothetical protein